MQFRANNSTIMHDTTFWLVTLNKPWNLIGRFDIVFLSYFLQFRAKYGAIREYIAQLRANQFAQLITSDFRMDPMKAGCQLITHYESSAN